MGRRRRSTFAAFVLAGTLAAALIVPAVRGAPHFVVAKGHLVAPLATPANPHPGPVPGCRRPGLDCLQTTIRRLHQRENRLGCDHRAVFATTYRVLTQVMMERLQKEPGFFRFPRYLYFEDGLFADVYVANSAAWSRGARVPPAWRIAFETARDSDVTAAQDMLLGINAHVQNDMPFVLAALGQHTRGGISRKPDHDRENEILADAYQRVVDTVKRRYDPSVGVTNPDGVPADDAAGLELVKKWREDVWHNAERLIATRNDPQQHAEVVDDIEQNAAQWATGIAAEQTPGYRAQRDAYCEARLGS
jgi:hypothetical protein